MDENVRKQLEKIFFAGLRAVDPENAVRRHVRLTGSLLQVGEKTYSLDDFRRIFVTGVGKGTAPMAKALEDILGDRLTGGWIIVKYDHGLPLGKIRVFEAAHPVPDDAGLEAARFLLERLAECTEKDLVICAFSGGGSALFPSVRPPLTFENKQKITRLLLECGATINEINCIRKHMSLGKGGQLARIAFPATVISLFLSDVVGDPLDVIASGPTVPDTGTFADCLEIMDKFGITDRVPAAVLQFFKDGARGLLEETPKAGDVVFQKNQNLVVGSNRAALLAAEEQAIQLGYNTQILSSFIEGEAREVAAVMAALGKEIIQSGTSAASTRMYTGGR